MNINYNFLFKFSMPYIYILFFTYIISSILYFYLPSNAKLYISNENNELKYKRYDFYKPFKQKVIAIKTKKNIIKTKQEYSILTSISLIAIYAFDNKNGYIIIKEKSKSETIILSTNESFKGYILKEVLASYVIFEKNNNEYKLSIEKESNNLKYDVITQNETIVTTKSISVEDGQVSVKRDLIDSYINNFDKIWQDISIKEVKTSNGVDGFKVTRIKKGTAFEKIGLKKNDIIKSINNIKLKSYNDAFKIYRQINKIKSLNLVVLRNNIEMEIYYEIK